ncbi:MAG: hypothetical protein QME12_05075 [Nanoarchaeota archaeon]|nr:hypothetical protein [Nanoarchaeota archaeon]
MKRKSLELQKQVLQAIRKNPSITLSQLERKMGTNPKSLKEHCESLAFLGLIELEKTKETTRLRVRS